MTTKTLRLAAAFAAVAAICAAGLWALTGIPLFVAALVSTGIVALVAAIAAASVFAFVLTILSKGDERTVADLTEDNLPKPLHVTTALPAIDDDDEDEEVWE